MQEKILRISSPVARKSHTCEICGKQIEKGVRYMNVSILCDGRVRSKKVHQECHANKSVKSEKEFREIVSIDTKTMLDTFTFKENMQIAFFPLVITELAWIYAFHVLDMAARYKIGETKKLSRVVKELRERYVKDCMKDLDRSHFDHIVDSTEKFRNGCSNDFAILYYSANSELKRSSYGLPYLDLRTYAYVSVAMIDALLEHNRRMNKLIAERLGCNSSLLSEKLPATTVSLRECMEAYMSPANYVKINHIQTSISILLNKISQCEFVIH